MSSNKINSFGNYQNHPLYQARPTSAQNINVVTPLDIDLTQTSAANSFYTTGTNSITCSLAGIYFVSFNIAWQTNSAGQRFVIAGRLTQNNVDIAGAYSLTYARDTASAEDGVNNWAGLIEIADNTILRLKFQQGASSDVEPCNVDTDDRSRIIIRKMSF